MSADKMGISWYHYVVEKSWDGLSVFAILLQAWNSSYITLNG